MTRVKQFLPELACLLLLIAGMNWVATLRAQERLEIEIIGIEGALLDNVRAYLTLTELAPGRSMLPTLPFGDKEKAPALTESEIRRRYRRARKEIGQALQPFGYYEPAVDTSLNREGDIWRARFEVEPGPATLIESIDINIAGDGGNDAGIQKALAASKLKLDQRLDHSFYEATKENLLKAALAAGYLDAGYSRAELRILKSARRARVVLHLNTGPRYYFGEIDIEQQILDPAFVQRFVHIKPGEPFDIDKLLKLQLALSDSGFLPNG